MVGSCLARDERTQQENDIFQLVFSLFFLLLLFLLSPLKKRQISKLLICLLLSSKKTTRHNIQKTGQHSWNISSLFFLLKSPPSPNTHTHTNPRLCYCHISPKTDVQLNLLIIIIINNIYWRCKTAEQLKVPKPNNNFSTIFLSPVWAIFYLLLLLLLFSNEKTKTASFRVQKITKIKKNCKQKNLGAEISRYSYKKWQKIGVTKNHTTAAAKHKIKKQTTMSTFSALLIFPITSLKIYYT